jgi:hypothetical protein
MPARDRHHETVKRALIKDGWAIEDEQFPLTIGERNLWIDLQASRGVPRYIIFVEVKGLAEVDSMVEALARALGKFFLYRLTLEASNLDFPLFLAVSRESYEGILSEPLGLLAVKRMSVPLIVFDHEEERIVQWTMQP